LKDPLEKLAGFLRTSLLGKDNAQVVKCGSVIGKPSDNLAVNILSFGEASRSLLFSGNLQSAIDADLCHRSFCPEFILPARF
jgi:hypothetical protein